MTSLPRVGITESLIAPGLAVPPPVSVAANKLGQLQEILGLAGNAVLGVSEANREASVRAEREAAQADDAFRGQASVDFRTRQADLAAKIADRSITVPAGVTPAEFAQSLAEQETVGFPDQYRKHYADIAVPRLTDLLVGQREQIKSESKADDIRLRTEAIVQATSADEMNRIASETAKLYNLSETERASMLVPALKSAALNADAGRFESAKSAIGTAFPLERDAAQAVYDRETAQQKAEKNRAVIDHLQGRIDAGAPIETVEQELKMLSLRGAVDPTSAATIYNQIESQKRQVQAQAERDRVAAFETDVNNSAIIEGEAFASNPNEPGGGLYMFAARGDVKVPIPGTDKSVTVKTKEIAQQITDNRMRQIAAANPDPQVALAKQVQFVADNKIVPTEWNALLNNADTSASIDQIVPVRTKEGGYVQPPKAPPNLLAAFGLYRQLSVANPRVARDTVTDASAELLYDTAETVQQYSDQYADPSKALLAASRSINSARTRPAQQYELMLNVRKDDQNNLKYVVGYEDGKNQQYVFSWLTRAAEFYRNIDGISDVAAIDRAKQRFNATHSIINDQYVYTRGLQVPDFINEASKIAAEKYATNAFNLSANDTEPDEYGLVPDGQNGWELKRKVGDYYMELPDPAFYTNQDLEALVRANSAKMTSDENATKPAAIQRILKERKEGPSALLTGFSVHRDD